MRYTLSDSLLMKESKIAVLKKEVETLEPIVKLMLNPFMPIQNCFDEECKENLTLNELSYPHEGKFFCEEHHPLLCEGCQTFIKSGKYSNFHGKVYHSDCLLCFSCTKPITSGTISIYKSLFYMHGDCAQSEQTMERQGLF